MNNETEKIHDNTQNKPFVSDSLKKSFLDFVESKKTTPLSSLSIDEFRIATYNIHYFTDIYEIQNTYEAILHDIQHINADIIGLQEFILGNKVKIKKNLVIDLTEFYDKIEQLGYSKSVLCNSVPSWFKSLYGNIVLISSRICTETDKLCESLSETIHTFEKSNETVEVSGSHQGTNETRCYIKIKSAYNGKNIYIYTTHLDVASEHLRKKQIKYIIKDSKRHNRQDDVVFIMGDFNTFDEQDIEQTQFAENWKSNEYIKHNGEVVNLLKRSGFVDCHKTNPSNITAWNNTRVDFIFCNKTILGDFRAEYLYTTNSDHLPVILTLTSRTVFGSNKSKTRKRKSRKSRLSRKRKLPSIHPYKTSDS